LDCILAIDVGTTSAKALLVNGSGEVLTSARHGYPTYYPEPGYAEQNPVEVLQAILQIIKECADKKLGTIRGLCFSSAMHSLMAVDQQGSPLTPLIIWADARSGDQAKRLRTSSQADFIYHTSGTPIHPMSPLCKLLWMKENARDLIERTDKFISIKEFIVHQLSGHYLIDYSIASATGLFDIKNLNWSPEIIAEAGISSSQLSPICSPYAHVPLMKAGHEMLGLPLDTPLILGASDGCLANLGSGAMEKGELSITVGTSGAVRMASRQLVNDPHHRVFTYRLDETFFIIGGATNNGLVLKDWFQKLIGGPEKDLVSFVGEGRSSPAGANGLLFLPYVFGERAPYYNSDLRGAYLGLAQHHTRADMTKALMEGICFELRSIVASIENLQGPIVKVLASGGITRADEWLQILANVLDKEVSVRDTNDASAMGAASMGFHALGIPFQFRSEDDSKIFVPEKIHRALYNELFELFEHSTQVLTDGLGRLAALTRSGK
jgi:gluconokinase